VSPCRTRTSSLESDARSPPPSLCEEDTTLPINDNDVSFEEKLAGMSIEDVGAKLHTWFDVIALKNGKVHVKQVYL